MSVHTKATSEAARVKRRAQRLIGRYIEHLVKCGLESLDAKDREFLDLLCPRVTMKDIKNDVDDVVEDDNDGGELAGLVEDIEEEEEEEDEGDKDDTDLGGSGGSGGAQ
ncbi:hypothetical protein BGZ80_006345, partial [Entomortierella chlamydospora]